MNLESIVAESKEMQRKTGMIICENWTWKLYIGADCVETISHRMSPSDCLNLSSDEWKNVEAQGCAKMEIVRDSDNSVVKTWEA